MLSQGVSGWTLPGSPASSGSRWATVSTDVLNVREAPTTDSAVLAKVAQGDPVRVIGEPESGFVPVAYDGGSAWMAQEYLSYDVPAQALTANPLPVQDVAAAATSGESSDADFAEPVAPEPEPEVDAVEAQPVVDEAAAPVEPAERWIEIDRATATVTLHEGGTSIASFSGRIGRDPSPDGFYSTAVGTFHVYSLNKGLAPTPFADDTWLTDWVGFDPDRKNGIHSPVRDADGVEKASQNPTTLGCVRLNAEAAVAVFDFAEIGMRVEVHD